MTAKLVKEINLSINMQELPRLASQISALCEENEINDEICYRLNLVLDELVTNIISYGFGENPAEGDDHIVIRIHSITPHRLKIELIDKGIAFDPLEAAAPDITASVEDRKVGGLGIFFAKQFTEEITYKRQDDKNHLIMLIDLKRKLTTNDR